LPVGAEFSAQLQAFIPVQAKPPEVFANILFIAQLAALNVGILGSEDHPAAMLPCEQPVK
jgi:hypothetical protein